ncbi:MAG: hypothetical protein PHY34_06200 [Patescibacteria group bacterium]|nr:hypothetical protein [Patescibacteria group bacterium]
MEVAMRFIPLRAGNTPNMVRAQARKKRVSEEKRIRMQQEADRLGISVQELITRKAQEVNRIIAEQRTRRIAIAEMEYPRRRSLYGW